MRAAIAGLGLWLPDAVLDNDAWPEGTARDGDRTLVDVPQPTDRFEAITRRHLARDAADPFLGARQRRVAEREAAWEAEAEAGRAALADAGVDPGALDAVLSWSIVTDRPLLPTATKVAHALGATRAWGAGLDAGCASAITGLDVAAGLIESGRARHVLLTQSHLITRAFPRSHPAAPGVGDCATAAVVSASERPGVLTVEMASHGEHWDAVTWVRGRDDASDTPWWKAGGDYGPGSRAPGGAKTLMQNTVRFGVETCAAALDRARIAPSEVAALASVQPRGWIPEAIAEVLGVPEAPTTFTTLAHVGGCGVIANLLEARRRGLLDGGRPVLLYAQGAGFTRAAAVVRFSS
ncbi:MAG: 3-oxoacyl-[acyl-carrier-protein] synthase III C-terminal domain-containing protein [Myxococcota bacterium]|nr:3-oxoacyl-[acyl-carrier-protein] synthase III C-terminal domain-containing protein [Myxococcota bacterium]